jgi:outer membrane protein OmpA-like peptidoglycan-associated protein/uncharacterized protein YecT (DUF1311 family)
MLRKRLLCSLAGAVYASLSTHVDARDFRPCLTIQDVNQRIECLEGRSQPPSDTAVPLPAPNFSPSFPCDKASSRIELLICSDAVLAQLDAQMGQAYSQALKRQSSATLIDDQRRWLASRDGRCTPAGSSLIRACLIQFTTERIERLTALSAIQQAPLPAIQQAPLPDAPPVAIAPAFSAPIETEKSAEKIVAVASRKPEIEPQLPADEAAASKVLIERIQSLLNTSSTQRPKFFKYSVNKKDLRGYKSDMPILRVVYEERIFFDTDKANLRPEALLVVRSIASTLKQQKKRIALFVAGHTDARGPDQYNLDLSIRRAEAVARAIKTEGSGIAYIWHIGFGKAIPIRPNNSAQNMALNRRVEFLIASQAEVITAWIKTTKVCEDEVCGTTSVVSDFKAVPVSDQGTKPINIEIPTPKPVEIEIQFHPTEIGPPLK